MSRLSRVPDLLRLTPDTRAIHILRLLAVGALLATAVVAGYVGDRITWRTQVAPFVIYPSLAAIVLLVGRTKRFVGATWIAIAALDTPAAAAVTYRSLPFSTEPHAVAARAPSSRPSPRRGSSRS